MAASERIVLGSGKLYCVEGTKTDGVYTIPADNVLEDDDNLLGYIQGGATIEYTPSFSGLKYLLYSFFSLLIYNSTLSLFNSFKLS